MGNNTRGEMMHTATVVTLLLLLPVATLAAGPTNSMTVQHPPTSAQHPALRCSTGSVVLAWLLLLGGGLGVFIDISRSMENFNSDLSRHFRDLHESELPALGPAATATTTARAIIDSQSNVVRTVAIPTASEASEGLDQGTHFVATPKSESVLLSSSVESNGADPLSSSPSQTSESLPRAHRQPLYNVSEGPPEQHVVSAEAVTDEMQLKKMVPESPKLLIGSIATRKPTRMRMGVSSTTRKPGLGKRPRGGYSLGDFIFCGRDCEISLGSRPAEWYPNSLAQCYMSRAPQPPVEMSKLWKFSWDVKLLQACVESFYYDDRAFLAFGVANPSGSSGAPAKSDSDGGEQEVAHLYNSKDKTTRSDLVNFSRVRQPLVGLDGLESQSHEKVLGIHVRLGDVLDGGQSPIFSKRTQTLEFYNACQVPADTTRVVIIGNPYHALREPERHPANSFAFAEAVKRVFRNKLLAQRGNGTVELRLSPRWGLDFEGAQLEAAYADRDFVFLTREVDYLVPSKGGYWSLIEALVKAFYDQKLQRAKHLGLGIPRNPILTCK
eukprot:TRINITY_DN30375_c0_g1_i1.p1 TRINITY_DN30375_c0_g1~~TRINITY_DN30375_c0_g1_i1.p1  ORF type:complete len:552 (+),score=29.65 TRINITY_DN30375_c0_g1_i1:80-1735(+)